MGDLQGLKRPRLLLVEPVAIVISGVIAGALKAFQRLAAVECPRHDTTMAIADKAGTT